MTLDATIVVTATLAALPPTIVALASWRQSRKNADKADTIIGKADEIHTLTNSNLTSVKSELAQANKKIGDLEKIVVELAQRPSDGPRPQKLPNRARRSG